MGAQELTPNQRRTLKAREALAQKLADPETRRNYFADLARRQTGHIKLSPAEAQALVEAFVLLERIAARARKKLADAPADEGGAS